MRANAPRKIVFYNSIIKITSPSGVTKFKFSFFLFFIQGTNENFSEKSMEWKLLSENILQVKSFPNVTRNNYFNFLSLN